MAGGKPIGRGSAIANRTEHLEETVGLPTQVVTPLGPRVRWGGVMSGFFVAIATLFLLTALDLAIGITALGDPWVATGGTASGLGIGSWTTFGVMVVTLAVAIAGAISGVPSFQRWRQACIMDPAQRRAAQAVGPAHR